MRERAPTNHISAQRPAVTPQLRAPVTHRPIPGSRRLNTVILVLSIAALFVLLFVLSFRTDRRRLRNGVYLLIALGILALAGLSLLSRTPDGSNTATLIVFGTIPLGVLFLVVFLLANGLTIIRKEGRSLANLLSFLLGLAILVSAAYFIVVITNPSTPRLALSLAVFLFLTLAYLSFVFTAYFLYSLIYGRLSYQRHPDAVIVLGSGIFGERVPPLLASRLQRAADIFTKEYDGDNSPILITSGGQGPGESIPEALAMKRWLVERGVPEAAIVTEDRSRNTSENIAFSQVILRERGFSTGRPDASSPEAPQTGDAPAPRRASADVVTSNYHVFRAAMETRHHRLDADVVGSPTAFYFLPSAVIREFVGVLRQFWWVHALVIAAIAALTFVPGLGV